MFTATKNKCVFLVKDDDLEDLEGKVMNQYGIKGVSKYTQVRDEILTILR